MNGERKHIRKNKLTDMPILKVSLRWMTGKMSIFMISLEANPVFLGSNLRAGETGIIDCAGAVCPRLKTPFCVSLPWSARTTSHLERKQIKRNELIEPACSSLRCLSEKMVKTLSHFVTCLPVCRSDLWKSSQKYEDCWSRSSLVFLMRCCNVWK